MEEIILPTINCTNCNTKLHLQNNKVAFAFYQGGEIRVSHWTCLSNHRDPNLVAIKRAKWEQRPHSLEDLSPGELRAAKTLAKKKFGTPPEKKTPPDWIQFF